MGKKYVIELEDEPFVRKSCLHGEEGLYRTVGFRSLVFDKVGLEKLTPLDTEKELAKAKQEGAEEAWELAKWAFSEASDSDLADAFPYEWNNGGFIRIMKLSFADAKGKYDDWLATDNEIRVGDEVTSHRGGGVVIWRNEEWVGVMHERGDVNTIDIEIVKRTGRHFSEVNELLKKMKEGI